MRIYHPHRCNYNPEGKFCLFPVILKMMESKDPVGIYHFERSRFKGCGFSSRPGETISRSNWWISVAQVFLLCKPILLQVAPGSKMRKLLEIAIRSMGEGKQVVWTGVGISMGKAISCAEILKRKFRAHQITKICYTKYGKMSFRFAVHPFPHANSDSLTQGGGSLGSVRS